MFLRVYVCVSESLNAAADALSSHLAANIVNASSRNGAEATEENK